VLIIEDDDRFRRVVPITLRREGLEVTEAGSGEEGRPVHPRAAPAALSPART
jgi:DNA-binding response OmpR family regulator